MVMKDVPSSLDSMGTMTPSIGIIGWTLLDVNTIGFHQETVPWAWKGYSCTLDLMYDTLKFLSYM